MRPRRRERPARDGAGVPLSHLEPARSRGVGEQHEEREQVHRTVELPEEPFEVPTVVQPGELVLVSMEPGRSELRTEGCAPLLTRVDRAEQMVGRRREPELGVGDGDRCAPVHAGLGARDHARRARRATPRRPPARSGGPSRDPAGRLERTTPLRRPPGGARARQRSRRSRCDPPPRGVCSAPPRRRSTRCAGRARRAARDCRPRASALRPPGDDLQQRRPIGVRGGRGAARDRGQAASERRSPDPSSLGSAATGAVAGSA